MRLVLMGTGPFAVPSFERIRQSGHEIAAVVVRPPVAKPGKLPAIGPVQHWGADAGLPLASPDSINSPDATAWLRQLQPDLLVVCDYGQILSDDALRASRLGGINLHGSRLPRHRGAAPVQWSILAGDATAGVSVIHMTPALDAGPILESAETPIGHDENAEQLEARLSQLGVEPTLRAIEQLSGPSPPRGQQQDPAVATKAPRLKKSDGELHLGYAVRLLDRQIRGLQPWPGVFGQLLLPDGKALRMLLHRARPKESSLPLEGSDLALGCVILGPVAESMRTQHPDLPKFPVLVRALDGYLLLESLQLAGKKPMSGEEFARGYGRYAQLRMAVPDTPQSLLERMQALSAEETRHR